MAFEARISRWRSVLLMLVAIGFVVLGLWLVGLIGPPPQISAADYAMGWVCIVGFGALGLLWARRLLRSGVEVRIDGSGVLYRRWSGQTIPWLAIERVEMTVIGKQKFACLYLFDPRAFPSVTLLGKLAGANKSLGFGDVVVSTIGTDQPFEALVAAFARFGPSRLANSPLPLGEDRATK